MSIPFRYMKSLLQSNQLNVSEEKVLIELFEKYLKHCETLPALPEEDESSKLAHLLTPEEQKTRADRKEEENKKKEEEAKAKEDAYNTEYGALKDFEKYNWDWRKKVEAVSKDCIARAKITRLTKEQKTELFRTIRYSYMSHEELIMLTQNTVFELAKDFILEGLSFRLNSFENAIKKDTRINTEPRSNFQS